MFETFDFGVLDSPDFKEDAVREEIIAPMLKRLGYGPSGQARVVRSRSLVHPFVRIGTRKQPVNIIPDYTLWFDEKPLLVLDAKSPREPIVESHHVEQAYSYAIHPEVRARHFALCNGKRLVLFDIDQFEPVLDVAACDFDRRWAELERYLSPQCLLEPARRHFQPDLGFALSRMGVGPATSICFPQCRVSLISRLEDSLFSMGGAFAFVGTESHIASFDFAPEFLGPLLSCLADPLARQVRTALGRSPFTVCTDNMLEVKLETVLGTVKRGDHGPFIPFVLTAILGSSFNRDQTELPVDVPPFVFRLRAAFDNLQKGGGAQ